MYTGVMLNFSAIGILGDTHGFIPWTVLALNTFNANGVNVILQVGDFGVFSDANGVTFRAEVNRALEVNGQVMYVTLGNHEDYSLVAGFVPHPTMVGFVYEVEYSNILYATRGARWVWEGVSFVSLGGANSIDWNTRTPWVNWWEGERISLGDVYRTVQDGHADVMITHDCPEGVNLFGNHRDANSGWSAKQIAYSRESRVMLRQAVDGVKPEILFHGHYHAFTDLVTEMFDGVDHYTVRTVGMGMNDDYDTALGVFILTDRQFNLLPVTR